MMTLQQLVKTERARLGLSLREVADRSGGLLSSSTIHSIEQGQRTSVEDDTLDGLARGLSLPLGRVARAAGVGDSDTDEPFVLPRRAQRLTRKEREHVLALVDLLLERRRR
jgi:transcriptional regulator with XRE-family HTH domain